MSENSTSRTTVSAQNAKTWRHVGWVAWAISVAAFLIGALTQFFPPHSGMAVKPSALFMGALAAVAAGVGIYTLNRHAALHSEDPFTALWTNLMCRILMIIELISLAAVCAWAIFHFIGVPIAVHF